MSYTVDAQTFLKFSQLPWFTVWEGVCMCGVWGYCEEGGKGEVFILSLFFSELVSDTIILHDYWVKTHISSLRCYHLINLVRIID